MTKKKDEEEAMKEDSDQPEVEVTEGSEMIEDQVITDLIFKGKLTYDGADPS